VRAVLILTAALAVAAPAVAAPAGVWGAGAQTCGEWRQARSGQTMWKDYFEGWAMGFLSDANVQRYPAADPNPAVGDLLASHNPEAYFRAIDTACAVDPRKLVVGAAVDVIRQLGAAEDLREAAVRR
jgi:hypothetical protein